MEQPDVYKYTSFLFKDLLQTQFPFISSPLSSRPASPPSNQTNHGSNNNYPNFQNEGLYTLVVKHQQLALDQYTNQSNTTNQQGSLVNNTQIPSNETSNSKSNAIPTSSSPPPSPAPAPAPAPSPAYPSTPKITNTPPSTRSPTKYLSQLFNQLSSRQLNPPVETQKVLPTRKIYPRINQQYDEICTQVMHQLGVPVCDIETIQQLNTRGYSWASRPLAWQLLLGYLHPHKEIRNKVLLDHRLKYFQLCKSITQRANQGQLTDTINLIRMDVDRTLPEGYEALFLDPKIKGALRRLLLVWAVEHPKTGYFQGLNDLAVPFLAIFSGDKEGMTKPSEMTFFDGLGDSCMADDGVGVEDPHEMAFTNGFGWEEQAEADAYWCLCKILDTLEHHNRVSKCGVHAESMMQKLEKLISCADPSLDSHMKREGVEYVQFAFRWTLCLCMREFSLDSSLLLWDSYISCGGMNGFNTLHVFVCAVMLLHFKDEIMKMDFMDMIKFLQHPPTGNWETKDITSLVERAYLLWKTNPDLV